MTRKISLELKPIRSSAKRTLIEKAFKQQWVNQETTDFFERFCQRKRRQEALFFFGHLVKSGLLKGRLSNGHLGWGGGF